MLLTTASIIIMVEAVILFNLLPRTLPKLKIKVQTNAQAIKPHHYAKTAMVTLLFRTLESERYLLTLPYIFSAHLAHKARKTKPKLSHAIKSHIQKIA